MGSSRCQWALGGSTDLSVRRAQVVRSEQTCENATDAYPADRRSGQVKYSFCLRKSVDFVG